MIYLDGDIQVYENIDNLFSLPDGHFYAVMDCFCQQLGYHKQCPDKVKWPAELGQPPSVYFNAGMFVFAPSLSTNQDLLKTLKVAPPTPFAEQVFAINQFFSARLVLVFNGLFLDCAGLCLFNLAGLLEHVLQG
jgi:inositol 3-alpha-galactosyltransferase